MILLPFCAIKTRDKVVSMCYVRMPSSSKTDFCEDSSMKLVLLCTFLSGDILMTLMTSQVVQRARPLTGTIYALGGRS